VTVVRFFCVGVSTVPSDSTFVLSSFLLMLMICLFVSYFVYIGPNKYSGRPFRRKFKVLKITFSKFSLFKHKLLKLENLSFKILKNSGNCCFKVGLTFLEVMIC
jgi:hypothetical protein